MRTALPSPSCSLVVLASGNKALSEAAIKEEQLRVPTLITDAVDMVAQRVLGFEESWKDIGTAGEKLAQRVAHIEKQVDVIGKIAGEALKRAARADDRLTAVADAAA